MSDERDVRWKDRCNVCDEKRTSKNKQKIKSRWDWLPNEIQEEILAFKDGQAKIDWKKKMELVHSELVWITGPLCRWVEFPLHGKTLDWGHNFYARHTDCWDINRLRGMKKSYGFICKDGRISHEWLLKSSVLIWLLQGTQKIKNHLDDFVYDGKETDFEGDIKKNIKSQWYVDSYYVETTNRIPF